MELLLPSFRAEQVRSRVLDSLSLSSILSSGSGQIMVKPRFHEDMVSSIQRSWSSPVAFRILAYLDAWRLAYSWKVKYPYQNRVRHQRWRTGISREAWPKSWILPARNRGYGWVTKYTLSPKEKSQLGTSFPKVIWEHLFQTCVTDHNASLVCNLATGIFKED